MAAREKGNGKYMLRDTSLSPNLADAVTELEDLRKTVRASGMIRSLATMLGAMAVTGYLFYDISERLLSVFLGATLGLLGGGYSSFYLFMNNKHLRDLHKHKRPKRASKKKRKRK